tara:strand:+ start:354 stop:542 length:189 start_codon:yes stop_codon:yes gene_type:complete
MLNAFKKFFSVSLSEEMILKSCNQRVGNHILTIKYFVDKDGNSYSYIHGNPGVSIINPSIGV